MSEDLFLKQYGDSIEFSDQFLRLIDLGDNDEQKQLSFLELNKKYADKLIVSLSITEHENIYQATIQKSDLNGKYNVNDKFYVIRGAPAERFTQLKFYHESQQEKFWIVSADILHSAIDDILRKTEEPLPNKNLTISADKFNFLQTSKETLETNGYTNTPFDYCNDYDGEEFTSEIDFILKAVDDLYNEDSYRVKEGIRDLSAIIKCRRKARELAVNDEEFIALDQAMNFFYLTHFYQKKKRDQALDIVTKHYGVSRDKIISIWSSLVNYKRHFGEAIEFHKKNYKRKPR